MTILEKRATAVLAGMLDQVQRKNELDPVFEFWTGAHCNRLAMPPGTNELLNDGPAKDEIFRFFRRQVADHGVDSCVFGSDVWVFRTTKSAAKLHSPEQLRKLTLELPPHTLVDLGLAERFEALVVLAEDVNDVVKITQFYLRQPGFRLCGPPDMWQMKQAEFKGRMKMFGDLRAENLCEHATSPAAHKVTKPM